MTLNNVAVELGPHAGLACVVLMATASVAIRLLLADSTATPPPRGADAATEVTDANPVPRGYFAATGATSAYRALSTPQLCGALRSSYAPDPQNSARQTEWTQIQIRGDLLDEIERRDPAGFNRWLATTPQPGGDPARYLTPGR